MIFTHFDLLYITKANENLKITLMARNTSLHSNECDITAVSATDGGVKHMTPLE